MRMAKAPQEHVDRLRRWMQFNDELCKIDLQMSLNGTNLKKIGKTKKISIKS